MISTLGKKLPEQAVQIFICTFLPSTIWIGKIHVTMQPFLALAPVCKFYSPVTGNAFDQLRGKGGQRRNDSVLHGRGFSVSHLDCYVRPGLAFARVAKQALLLPWPLTTVSASQCPASRRLYTGLSRFRIDFPLLYLPRVSLLPWLFPLRCSTFSDHCLPYTSRRSSGRACVSWVSSTHKEYSQSVPVTKSPAAFLLCSRSPLGNGTFHGGSRNTAAGTSSALCVDSRLGCRTYGCSYAGSPTIWY